MLNYSFWIEIEHIDSPVADQQLLVILASCRQVAEVWSLSFSYMIRP